ncbi:MAG: transposase [Bryobacteraceae bacterium]
MTHSLVPSHSPYGTVLWAFIQLHFEAWLIYRKRIRRYVPRYVRNAFRNFLRCGDPEHGFTILACPTRHYSRYVAYRCKGRGFCIYCLLIRQRELGERLINRIIGNVPVRHLVFCFPPAFRFILGYDKALLDGGFAALAGAMFNHQRRTAVERFGVPWERIHPGCVEVAHRASASLVTNHHVHGIFPDGVFIERDDGTLEFHRLPRPSDTEIAVIAHEACLAFCAALKRRGFWETTAVSPDAVEGQLTLPRARPQRLKFFGQAAKDSEGGVAPINGAYAFHLFVGNAIEVEERPQLRQLVDYILAPPFLDQQLSVNSQGNLVLRLKRPRHDKAAAVELEPNEALDRFAELVSRPNANTVRYYGIYAPRSKLRKQAIALRVGDPGPARVTTGPMLCPLCGKALRVTGEVKGNRGRPDAVPPDIPGTRTPRGKDRIDRGTSDDGQGRLFR